MHFKNEIQIIFYYYSTVIWKPYTFSSNIQIYMFRKLCETTCEKTATINNIYLYIVKPYNRSEMAKQLLT